MGLTSLPHPRARAVAREEAMVERIKGKTGRNPTMAEVAKERNAELGSRLAAELGREPTKFEMEEEREKVSVAVAYPRAMHASCACIVHASCTCTVCMHRACTVCMYRMCNRSTRMRCFTRRLYGPAPDP